MTIPVVIEGFGQRLEFPDGTDPLVIQATVKRLLDEQRVQLRERDAPKTLAQKNPAEFDPLSFAFQQRFGPVGSGFQNFAAGAGKATVDLGRGVSQLAVEGADLIPGIDLGDVSQRLEEKQTAARERDAPLLETGAGLAGAITGNLATTLLPAGAFLRGAEAANLTRGANVARAFINPKTIGASVGTGATQGLLQPIGEGESRALNVGIGAVSGPVGLGLAKGASLIGGGVRNTLTRGGKEAVETLTEAGVPLDLAQRTGSTILERSRSAFGDIPFTAGRQKAFVDTQRQAFTKAVLKTIGSDSDEATQEVMAAARKRIGGVFNAIAKKSPAKIDSQLNNDLVKILREAQVSLLDDEVRLVEKNINNIFTSTDGSVINGQAFNRIRSTLGKLSKKPGVGQFARSMDEALLNSLERASPDDAAALQLARQQWRNLRTIQSSIDKGTDKLISPLRLSNTVANKGNQNLSVFGLGGEPNLKLVKLAQAGRQLIPESLPNSGTPGRVLIAGGILGGGAALTGDDPGERVSRAVGILALPLLLQRGLLSQSNLGRILQKGVPGAGLLGSNTVGLLGRQLPISSALTIQEELIE